MLIPYNLPPWMCLKEPFWIMSMLILGPKSPGNDIDVYLQPLIDELKQLWKHGFEIYNASLEHNFRLYVENQTQLESLIQSMREEFMRLLANQSQVYKFFEHN